MCSTWEVEEYSLRDEDDRWSCVPEYGALVGRIYIPENRTAISDQTLFNEHWGLLPARDRSAAFCQPALLGRIGRFFAP
jgi:hypothetical protein